MSSRLNVVLTGPGVDTSLRIDHRDLPYLAAIVTSQQGFQCLRGAFSCSH